MAAFNGETLKDFILECVEQRVKKEKLKWVLEEREAMEIEKAREEVGWIDSENKSRHDPLYSDAHMSAKTIKFARREPV